MAKTSVDDFLVDFSKEEESGGGGARYKPDTYKVRIVGAKTGFSEDKHTPYLEVNFAFLEGKYRKGKKKISERVYNTPKAMKRFRLLLNAVEVKVPAKLDLTKLPAKLKGKDLYIEIQDDEREGYPTRSRVAFEGFINIDDYDVDDVDDEELDEDEDEELEDEDEEEDEEEDEDEEDDELEDEDEEEEEEEEEEPPKRKRSSTKARSSKKASPRKSPRKSKSKKKDDDDDLSELDLDDL